MIAKFKCAAVFLRAGFITLAANMVSVPSAFGQTLGPTNLDNISNFVQALVVGEYHFSMCGDSRLAAIWDRAVLDLVDHCPFSDAANKRFYDEANKFHTQLNQIIQQTIATSGRLPERLDGMRLTCKEEQVTAGYTELRNKLERYANGEISAEEAMPPGRCDDPPSGL
jgi:hypothetical protein